MIHTIFFILFAGFAIGGALSVVLQRDVLYSALSLILTFIATAATFILLHAQFMAAIQMVVYAGAIIVLFVFVIMLLNVRSEESRIDTHRMLNWAGIPFALGLFAVLAYAVRAVKAPAGADDASVAVGTVEQIGNRLFTQYLLPFEATSVLILMAIVGSIVLARRAPEPGPALPVEIAPEATPELDEPLESLEPVEV